MHCAIFLSSFFPLKPFFYKHPDFSFWAGPGSLYLIYLVICSNRLWILDRRCPGLRLFACSLLLGFRLACCRLSCRICHALGCTAMIRGLVSHAVGVGCSLFLLTKCCRITTAGCCFFSMANRLVLCLHPVDLLLLLLLLHHLVNLLLQSYLPNNSEQVHELSISQY